MLCFFVLKVIRSTDAMPYKRHFSLEHLLLEKRENFRYLRRIFMKTVLPSIRLSFVFVKCKQLNYSINLFISLTLTLAFFHTNTLNIEIESDSNWIESINQQNLSPPTKTTSITVHSRSLRPIRWNGNRNWRSPAKDHKVQAAVISFRRTD